MIQDFTHVQYFATCLKDFPWCPSFLPRLPHTLKGFAHCTVLFLLKNPAHKQDKWFKNNSHNLTKINEGRGWMTRGAQGKEVGGWGVETCILSFRHASGRGGAGAAAAAILAGLQPLQGTWSLGLSFKSFSFHTQEAQRRKEKRKKSLATMRSYESCERKKANQLCGKPHLPLHPAPTYSVTFCN